MDAKEEITESAQVAGRVDLSAMVLPLASTNHSEAQSHVEWLSRLDQEVGGQCVWSKLEKAD